MLYGMSTINVWAFCLLTGMVCLHEQDIIHRDLKSSNGKCLHPYLPFYTCWQLRVLVYVCVRLEHMDVKSEWSLNVNDNMYLFWPSLYLQGVLILQILLLHAQQHTYVHPVLTDV